jgi:hypothetical protein
MSIYEDWLDRLDEIQHAINTELYELDDIYEVKKTEELSDRIGWLTEAKDKINEAMDALMGAIGGI